MTIIDHAVVIAGGGPAGLAVTGVALGITADLGGHDAEARGLYGIACLVAAVSVIVEAPFRRDARCVYSDPL